MYLDPAFGGMILQIVIALIAVGGAIIFSMRRKINKLFSKNKKAINNNKKPKESKGEMIDSIEDSKK